MKEIIIQIFLENPIGQIFGFLGMLGVIFAFLQNDDKNVIKILAIANIFWVVHFLLMGLYSGAFMVIVSIVRLYLSLKYSRDKHIYIMIFIITLIIGIITYTDITSIFPIIASLLATYAFFFLTQLRLRVALLLCSTFWLSYNFLHFSIGGIINESVIHVIHLITIYKIVFHKGSIFDYIKLKVKRDYGRYLAIIDYIKIKMKFRKK